MNTKDDYRVDIPLYEGPLDLLLSLIERNELEITRISLAQVADQYLSYIAHLEEAQPEMLADFLVIAAKLVLIKSEALLPRPSLPAPEGELDPGEELARQLRLYRQFKLAAGRLGERQRQGMRTYVRVASPPQARPQLDLTGISLDHLLEAARQALQVVDAAQPVGEMVPAIRITVKGQIEAIRTRLATHHRIVFQEMLGAAASRIEVIVTLLATLELLKQQQVVAYQERMFGPILIEASPPGVPGAEAGPG